MTNNLVNVCHALNFKQKKFTTFIYMMIGLKIVIEKSDLPFTEPLPDYPISGDQV